MAKVDEQVLAAVEGALAKNPEATVDELFDLAKGINRSIGRLNKRQFHARYPLQIKRRKTRSSGAGRKKGRKKKAAATPRGRSARKEGSTRDSVRTVLLRFASELAGAEDRKDIVRVVAGVDRYVDEVLKSTGTN